MSAFGGKADIDGDPSFSGLLTLVGLTTSASARLETVGSKILPVLKI